MISKMINESKIKIKEIFSNTSDLVIYEFETLSDTPAMIVYLNGLVDKRALNEYVIGPLIEKLISPLEVRNTIYLSEVEEVKDYGIVTKSLTDGHVMLFLEGLDFSYVLNICSYETRSIQESSSEQVIKGPKESFIEDLFVNKTLIRRKIRNNNLIFEDYVIGQETNTKVSVFYLKGIVNEEILAELKARLNTIHMDAIIDSHYISEHIDDNPYNFVSTIFNTEKPDVVAGKILEGRIGILCDGSPLALTLPRIFVEDFMTSEDYYLRPQFSTFLRFIRIIAYFTSMLLLGSYIAVSLYHREMIPTKLLISIASQRQGVPLPAFLEGLLMLIFFEFLKEAGLRLPKPIGATVSLVGGLVIGQAAVQAGLVSAIMVIIVSVSGITEFINLHLRELVVLYRFVFLALGSLFGLYGIACGLVIMGFHMVSIKSFGVPFLYPIAPYDPVGLKDFLLRASLKKLNYRPKYIADENSRKRSADYGKKN